MPSLKGAATTQQHLIVALRGCRPSVSDPLIFKRSWKSALLFEIFPFLNVVNISLLNLIFKRWRPTEVGLGSKCSS